jgi:hypothetical protein
MEGQRSHLLAQSARRVGTRLYAGTMSARLTILYRPVGRGELELIRARGFLEFPPRLPEQPIFYPVLTGGVRDSDRARLEHEG